MILIRRLGRLHRDVHAALFARDGQWGVWCKWYQMPCGYFPVFTVGVVLHYRAVDHLAVAQQLHWLGVGHASGRPKEKKVAGCFLQTWSLCLIYNRNLTKAGQKTPSCRCHFIEGAWGLLPSSVGRCLFPNCQRGSFLASAGSAQAAMADRQWLWSTSTSTS